jgi:hypothetical protein
VALVGPEQPAWWEARGFMMTAYPLPQASPDPELEAFFGPLHPPHQLLLKRLPRSDC